MRSMIIGDISVAWLFNSEEKEQYVMQIYEENRSIREIAKLMQMSFRDIGIIINKVKAKTEREREHTDEEEIHDIRRKSKEYVITSTIF